jgi:RecB family endonuclease NucS
LLDNEKFTVLKDPTLEEAKSIIERVFLNRKTLVLAGNCKVIYDGRASSKLDLGERLLIVKSDGAILVHRSLGYEPVNWQPSGCILHVQMKSNKIQLTAIRHNPRETLRIIFDKIFMLSAMLLDDSADFTLFASEKDMHQAILLKPSLIEEGFKPISYEKKVAPGFIDVYGVDKNGKLVVIEVKRKIAGKEAVLQLANYVKAIETKASRDIRGVLVAPNISKGVQKLLATLNLEFISLDPRKCAKLLKKPENTKLENFF